MSDELKDHPYRTLAKQTLAVQKAAEGSRSTDFADEVRKWRHFADRGAAVTLRVDQLADLIADLSKTRDHLQRRYASMRDMLSWFSVGVGSIGGIVGLLGIALSLSRITAAVALAFAVGTVAIARMAIVFIDGWLRPAADLDGLIADLRVTVKARPNPYVEQIDDLHAEAQKQRLEIAGMRAELDAALARRTEVRVDHPAEASTMTADDRSQAEQPAQSKEKSR